MVDRAERDPTMEEIVVALRETRRAAGRAVPFAVVNGRADELAQPGQADTQRVGGAGVTDIADLRDGEIQRLLAENAQLNQRVISLLKVLEHQQGSRAVYTAPATNHDAIFSEVKAALNAELRPVLDVLLRLLEALRGTSPRRGQSTSAAPQRDAGIIDLDAPRPHE